MILIFRTFKTFTLNTTMSNNLIGFTIASQFWFAKIINQSTYLNTPKIKKFNINPTKPNFIAIQKYNIQKSVNINNLNINPTNPKFKPTKSKFNPIQKDNIKKKSNQINNSHIYPA